MTNHISEKLPVPAPQPEEAQPKEDKAQRVEKDHESDELDEELDDSFPASDPPSSTQP